MIRRFPLVLALLTTAALAEEPVVPEAPTKASLKKLEDGRLQLGDIVFDAKSREIRFPAQVNMTDGALEFLIVLEKGKVHESLFSTTILPTNLNVAFKLLRYPASLELYPLPNDTGGTSGDFPEVEADVKAGARIGIDVEWQDGGKTRRTPVNEWVQHGITAEAMPAGPWVYGGSVVDGGKFAPDMTGDVAAIYLSAGALLLYPGEDKENDDVWTPFPKRVPPVGTKVTIVIAPFKKSQPLAKP